MRITPQPSRLIKNLWRITTSYVVAEYVALALVRGLPRADVLVFSAEILDGESIEIIWVDERTIASPRHRATAATSRENLFALRCRKFPLNARARNQRSSYHRQALHTGRFRSSVAAVALSRRFQPIGNGKIDHARSGTPRNRYHLDKQTLTA